MSNFFGKLSRTLGWGPLPTKVLNVQWGDYAHKHYAHAEGMFIVVALPEVVGDGDLKFAYEVIMHHEFNNSTQAYSLLRVISEEDGIQIVKEYKKILPCFVESCGKEFFNHSTLQKVLDVLREKPTFLPSHIAAYFGFIDALKHVHVIRTLNECEDNRGLYALHVAVENESEKIINHLLAAGATLEVFDKFGNSPLHLAAAKNPTVIQALRPRGHRCLNLKNNAGETPLLLASLANKLDNIKTLIHSGANVNHMEEVHPDFDTASYNEKLQILETTKDISHKDLNKGGSLLHWVKTKEMINVALDLGCSPNFTNCLGQTPLHIMVIRGRVTCLMTLLSRGANPNVANLEGDRPLHLAASLHHITMVQALICFGTDLNDMNYDGKTPRHIAASTRHDDRNKMGDKEKTIYLLHAVGAQRCKKVHASCSEGCSINGSFNGVPLYEKPLPRSRWVFDDTLARSQIAEAIKYQNLFRSNFRGRGRVLCLDGGGIKGLALCQMLSVIEKCLGQSITESFDWICGTSTGGFLALDIATGKSVHHAQSLYFGLKDKIFVGTRPYDTKDLEAFLKDEFGEDTVMSSIKKCRVSVTTTLADRLPADLHLFRNYEAPIDLLGIGESSDFVKPLPPNKQKVWMAARASGAAPTYFSSTDKYLDGGMVSNNPVLDTLTEIEEWNMSARAAGRDHEVFTPTVVVSLGCGKSPVVKVDNVDLTVPSILDMRRGFQAMVNMFNLLVEQACASEGRVVDRARSWCGALRVPFFRFNPQLSEDCNIDESDDAKLVRVMWESRAYMQRQSNYLLQLKDFLLSPENQLSVESAEPPLPPPRRSASAPSTPLKQGKSLTSIALSSIPQHALIDEGLKLRETLSECPLRQTPTEMGNEQKEICKINLSSPEDETFYSTDSEFEVTSPSPDSIRTLGSSDSINKRLDQGQHSKDEAVNVAVSQSMLNSDTKMSENLTDSSCGSIGTSSSIDKMVPTVTKAYFELGDMNEEASKAFIEKEYSSSNT